MSDYSLQPDPDGIYSAARVVEFLRKCCFLERSDLVEFFIITNNGKDPHDSYIDGKWESLRGNPGLFICSLGPERAEKFMGWVLSREGLI